MRMILVSGEAIGLIVGSLVAGVLLCWLLWSAFKLVRHPEWGPPFVLAPVILTLVGKLPNSEFIGMSLVFAVMAAGLFWMTGGVQRAQRRSRGQDTFATRSAEGEDARIGTPHTEMKSPSHRRYPAIAACISEARPASHDELKKVASRIRREAFDAPRSTSSFAQRRTLLRAAKTALEGVPPHFAIRARSAPTK